MAKLECSLKGDFYDILNDIESAVMGGSISASLEESSDFLSDNCICAVRVYERYSYMGGNRVSMNVTLLKADGNIHLSVITSGGSQAMFFKINTWGEKSFLDTIRDTVSKYAI